MPPSVFYAGDGAIWPTKTSVFCSKKIIKYRTMARSAPDSLTTERMTALVAELERIRATR
jgi:hypothetical protein